MLPNLSFGHERIPFGAVDDGIDADTTLDSDGSNANEAMEGTGEHTKGELDWRVYMALQSNASMTSRLPCILVSKRSS
jgi:hypothetical protein